MKKHGFMGLLLCMVFAIFISPLSVYAAYGQNGDNTIADTETYSHVTEKISDYAAAHEMQVDSSLLTYAYRYGTAENRGHDCGRRIYDVFDGG